MSKARRKYSAEFKTRIVIEMLKETQTLSEISSKHGIHPAQLTRWRRIFLEKAPEIFSESSDPNEKGKNNLEDDLYKKIGQLQIELDWLKKKLGISQ